MCEILLFFIFIFKKVNTKKEKKRKENLKLQENDIYD